MNEDLNDIPEDLIIPDHTGILVDDSAEASDSDIHHDVAEEDLDDFSLPTEEEGDE